jgi:hypothetical protein
VGWRDLLAFQLTIWTPAALLLLAFVAVHGMIAWNLSQSVAAIDAPQVAATGLGFDPVLPAAPRSVLPAESEDAGPAAR